MPEVDIIRKEVVLVDHVEPDNFGNIIVIDKSGKSFKVNQKHSSLQSVFVPGSAVEVGYGSYMNKEFIHTAQPVKDILPPSKPAPQGTYTKIEKHIDPNKDRGVGLSYAVDLAGKDKIPMDNILDWGEIFARFITKDIEVDETRIASLLTKKKDTK